MKIKKGFLMREIAGRFVVVPVGAADTSFHGMIQMNKMGAFLWEQLTDERSREDLIQAVLEKYEVEEAKAAHNVDVFLKKLTDAEIITV